MLAKHSRSAAEGSNRLTGVTGTDVSSFAYNGLGDRYQQIVNSATTTYQLDLAAGLVNVLADGGNTYLYGNTVVAQMSETQTGYYLPDVLGSVRQMTLPTGEVQLSQRFTPFGEVKEKYGDGEAAFGYTGQKYDAQTGLLYLRARYYAPGTGRFISHDTWSGDVNMPMSYNKWLYGYGNPVKYVDPSGEIPKREDITDGQVVYSSKCGFIDFGHVNTFVVNKIIDALKKEEFNYNDNEKYHVFTAKFGTPPTFVSEKNSSVTAIVQKGLSEQQKIEVALGIWRTLNDKVETHQNALWFTSYSFEDLSSDEIGFYLALEKGNVDPRVNQDSWDWLADKCGIDKENCIQKSLDVYDAWGGFIVLLANPPKIEEWGRALVCRGESEFEEVDLPAIFTRITPILPSTGGIWYEKPDETWWEKWSQKK